MISRVIRGAFTVVSIDNLDKLFSKSYVCVSGKSRCWNGTTVNAYNPKPCSLRDEFFNNKQSDKEHDSAALPNHTSQVTDNPCNVKNNSKCNAQKEILPLDLRKVAIYGDGNCLFRALATAGMSSVWWGRGV